VRSSRSSVGRIRKSKLSRLFTRLVAFLLVGCGGPSFPTAPEVPSAPRRPDGVALEPTAAVPPGTDRAEAKGVVALREPLADRDVEDLVRAYLHHFEREDETALAEMLTQDAVPLGRPNGTRQQLIEQWRVRIKAFEYQRLAGHEVARFAKLERWTYDALGAPGTPHRPVEMRPGDLYVRIPIATPRIGSEQLFGETLAFLLRREDGRLKIAGQADEN
jgi:hypothetical protein